MSLLNEYSTAEHDRSSMLMMLTPQSATNGIGFCAEFCFGQRRSSLGCLSRHDQAQPELGEADIASHGDEYIDADLKNSTHNAVVSDLQIRKKINDSR